MILIENTIFDDTSIAANLGAPEYSYYFVRKAFRHVLERFGTIVAVTDAETEVAPIHAAAKARGEECVFLSFNPPQYVPLGLDCPTIPVFAWEYDQIPDESWNANPQEDWRIVFARTGFAVTHCESSVRAVRRTMGEDFPIWSIPAPIYDKKKRYQASAHGLRAPTEIRFEGAVTLDIGTIDIEMFREERVDLEGTRALRLLRRLGAAPDWRQAGFTIEGVVYVSVFNTADGRKNWYELIAAFVWAFRNTPDATLILKVTHADLLEGMLPLLVHISKLGDFACRLLIVQGLLSNEAYDALIDVSSYAVNSSHGEGQCLPLMEFMSAGRPAVTPDHSAMADYVRPENSFVVGSDVKLASWPHDRRNAKRCLHHEVDFADMVRAYRESYRVAREDPQRYARMSAAAAAAQAAFCSDDVVAERLSEVFAFARTRGAAKASPPDDPRALGLYDAQLDGWYNGAAGELAAGFPISAADVVLDAGCGEGGIAGFAADRGAHLILTDIDADRLAAAAERVAGRAASVEVHLSAGDPLPLADATATRIVCREVIEHVDDPRAFVRELVRVGRPGALYLLTVPGAAQEHVQKELAPSFYFEKPNHIHIFEPDDFRALVEESGLVVERFSQEGFFWSLWFAFYWQSGQGLDTTDPTLAAWASTWSQALAGTDGALIKQTLDPILPKRQVIVARKPD